jgi:hypothetical protein
MADRLWIYDDRNGVQRTIEMGYQRGLSGDWTSGSMIDRVRAFNGLLLERARLMAGFWGEVSIKPDNTEVYIKPSQMREVPNERKAAAITLYRTVAILEAIDRNEGPNIETISGGKGETAEVGAWPIIAAAVIVSVAGVVAIAYCAEKGAELVDRQLARKSDLNKLIQRDTAVLNLAKQHQEAEAKAGKPLPMDPVTKTALESLLKQQEEIIKKIETPLQNRLPSISELPKVGSSIGIGALAGVLGVMVLLVWLK